MPAQGSLCKDGVARLGAGRAGQPPDVSQQRESVASGKGHVRLGCATKCIKFHSARGVVFVIVFLFCAAHTKLERTDRSGHHTKEGPCSKATMCYTRQGWEGSSAING